MSSITQATVFNKHKRLLSELENFDENDENKACQKKRKIDIPFLETNEQLFKESGYNYHLKEKLFSIRNNITDKKLIKKIDAIVDHMDQFRSQMESLPTEIMVQIAGYLKGDEIANLWGVSNEIKAKLLHKEIITEHFNSRLRNLEKEKIINSKMKNNLIEYIFKYANYINCGYLSINQLKLTPEEAKLIVTLCPNLTLYTDEKFDKKDNFFKFLSNYGAYLGELDIALLNHHFAPSETELSVNEFTKIVELCPNIKELNPPIEITNEMLQSLVELKNLKSLNLRDCKQIDDNGVASLKQLTNLEDLSFFRRNFSNAGLRGIIIELKNLKYLQLPSHTDIDDIALEGLTDSRQLIRVELWGCNLVTNNGLKNLKNLTNLKQFTLANNINVTDEGIKNLDGLVNITYINLQNCLSITNEATLSLMKMQQLSYLCLEGCYKITDEGIKNMEGLIHLRSVNLKNCSQLTDKALESLKKLNKLDFLVISGCDKITDQGMENLKSLPLRYLYISNTPGISAGCREYFEKKVKHFYVRDLKD